MLLPSRVRQPDCPDAMVDRARLYALLDHYPETRVIVVRAPAGYGKSSLVSRWLDVSGNAPQAVWLSLDEVDSDPREFMHNLSAALDTATPGLLTTMRSVLEDSMGDLQRAMRKLIATLWDEPSRTNGGKPAARRLLVLDDAHALAESEAASLLALLLEDKPPHLHVVLLTRQANSLPLARLFARGQAIELTAEDLRFTADEVQQYLLLREVSPSANELDQIMQRTEGWVAALQLALHSRRGHDPLGTYLGSLRGDSRWLAVYLTQEVLALQRPALRHFLLRTSILESFSAPLAAAVAGAEDAHKLLAELRQNELFLIPLDTEGRWYRYHHLFRELLNQRLAEVESKASIDELHRRAAAWLISNDQLLPAIRHLRAASEEDAAAALVESRIRPILLSHPVYALRLFDALSPDAALRRPRLMLERCLLSLMMYNKDLARHVHNFERSLADHPPSLPQRDMLEAELMVYHVFVYYAEGNLEPAMSLAQKAQRQADKLDPLTAGLLHFMLMRLSASGSDEVIQKSHAGQALAAFKEVNFMSGHIAVRRELAMIDIRAGRSAEASREFDLIALDTAITKLELDWIHIYAAEHAYWQDQLDRALHNIGNAMEIASTFQYDELTLQLTYLQRLYIFRSQGRRVEEKEVTPVGEASQFHLFVDWQIRWLLATDRIDEAWEVAGRYRARLPHDLQSGPYYNAIPYLRAAVARGENSEETQALLASALAGSSAACDRPRQLELLALKAWLELQNGDEEVADQTLARAENLAARIGYVRVLLDIPMLARVIQEKGLLLSAFAPTPDEAGPTTENVASLTVQELRVLRLLAAHKTYEQIGYDLVLSVNTVRSHVRHIYRKLSVNRRDQAIRQAIRCGLLLQRTG